MKPDGRACRGDSQIDLWAGIGGAFICVLITVLILTTVL